MDVLTTLRREVKAAGSQKALAERLGVSNTYLCDVLAGRRDPGDKILVPLGVEKVVTYRRRHSGD